MKVFGGKGEVCVVVVEEGEEVVDQVSPSTFELDVFGVCNDFVALCLEAGR